MAKQKKESIFVKENVNPKGVETGDCVFRSIVKATGLPYKKVVEDMTAIFMETGYTSNSRETAHEYLTQIGFQEVKMPRPKKGETRLKVSDIAKLSVDKPIICNVANHFTACVGGKVYDIWDCTSKAVYSYYIKV